MNPQQRPTIQDLVRTAMEKSAARIAVMEEAERLRTGEEPSKTASAEADDSIATDYAEKLAAAVEFLLPEVQVKEAGVADAVGGAVRRGAAAIASKVPGDGILAQKAMAAGGRMAELTDNQIGRTALGVGGGLAAAGAGAAALRHHLQNKEAGAIDRVKGAISSGKDKVMSAAGATADFLKNKKGKELAEKAKAVQSSGEAAERELSAKARSMSRDADQVAKMTQVPKRFVDEAVGTATEAHARAAAAGKATRADVAQLKKDSRNATIKSHAAKGALGVAAATGLGVAGKKVHDKHQEKKADDYRAGLVGLLAGRRAAAKVREAGGDAKAQREAERRMANSLLVGGNVGGALGAGAGALAGHYSGKGKGLGAVIGATGGTLAGLGGGYLHGMDHAEDYGLKQAEDAINPAHIRTPKASPLAAAPVRTESSQPGPSPQGNTGALSSNASAIAFSNRSNQAAKAEALRKYFSNPASDQHGDPALTKNFAHKTASASVEQARNILAALAAQVEGK